MPGTSTSTGGNAPRDGRTPKVPRLPEKGELMKREPRRVGKPPGKATSTVKASPTRARVKRARRASPR